MFGLVPAWVWVAVVAAVFAAGGATSWKVQDWRYAAKELEAKEAQAEKKRMDVARVDVAGDNFEKDKAGENVKYKKIYVEVEKIVRRDFYRDVCFDADGLRALNTAIGGTVTAQPQPSSTVRTGTAPQ